MERVGAERDRWLSRYAAEVASRLADLAESAVPLSGLGSPAAD